MPANRFMDIIRDDEGNPVSGITTTIKKNVDNTNVASMSTGGDGVVAFTEQEIGYPGPTTLRATDGTITRAHSGQSIGQIGPIWMSDLPRMFRMMTDGVFAGVDGGLAVSADGGARDVDVTNGMAVVYGLPSYWPVTQTVTIAANGNANPRIDLIVIRVIPPGVAEEGKQLVTVIAGTPSASPSAPSVTQNPASVYEIPLATVLVDPGASVITAGKVTDARVFTSGPLTNLAVTTAKLAQNAATAAKMSNETNYSTAALAKVLKANVSANATPVWATLNLSELADVSETAPTTNQILMFNGTIWVPAPAPNLTILVQEGDVTKVASANALDFNATHFNVSESPTGEANIELGAASVGQLELAGNAVTSAHVVNGSLTGADLATATVTSTNLAANIDMTKIADGSVTNTEVQYIGTLTSNAQAQLDDKASSTHTHTMPATIMQRQDFVASGTLASGTRTLSTLATTALTNGVVYDIRADLSVTVKNNVTTGVIEVRLTVDGAGGGTWKSFQNVGGVPMNCTWMVPIQAKTGAGLSIDVIAQLRFVSGDATDVRDGYISFEAIPRTVPQS